jgi:hypothetical protein
MEHDRIRMEHKLAMNQVDRSDCAYADRARDEVRGSGCSCGCCKGSDRAPAYVAMILVDAFVARGRACELGAGHTALQKPTEARWESCSWAKSKAILCMYVNASSRPASGSLPLSETGKSTRHLQATSPTLHMSHASAHNTVCIRAIPTNLACLCHSPVLNRL